MDNLFTLREFGLIVCVLSCAAHAQPLTGVFGAEARMLGGVSSTLNNLWSITNNPAGMSEVKHFQVGLYSEQWYAQPELKTGSMAALLPFKHVSVGAAVSYYGFAAFNQQRYTFSISKPLGKVLSLGVQGQYLGTFIQDYGSAGNWAVGMGLWAKPLKQLSLGLFIFNPTRSTYGQHTTERIPTYTNLGCTYEVSDKVKLLFEAQQHLEQRLQWRSGLRYQVIDLFALALGVSSTPTVYSFGVELKVKNMQLGLASTIHEVLGYSPHLGLTLPVKP